MKSCPRIRSAGIRMLGLQRRLVLGPLQQAFGMRLPVLLYHNVSPQVTDLPLGMTILPEQFEKQVRWLAKRGYSGIRPSQWLAWRKEGVPLPRKPVLLTFDDAYAGIAEHALPVLHKHGFGGAVFVVTRQIGGAMMSTDQIQEWADKGIEFGAHSRSHRDLTTLTEQELTDEVAGSSQDLGTLLGKRIFSFVYPYGLYNETVVEFTGKVFDVALTCDEGLNNLRTDLRLIRRSLVHPDDWIIDFACRVWFGWSPFKIVRYILRARSRVRGLFAVLSWRCNHR